MVPATENLQRLVFAEVSEYSELEDSQGWEMLGRHRVSLASFLILCVGTPERTSKANLTENGKKPHFSYECSQEFLLLPSVLSSAT